MNMMQAIKNCYSHYFSKKGRAPRSEYWYFFLWYAIFALSQEISSSIAFSQPQNSGTKLALLLVSIGCGIVVLASIVPLWMVAVRRLHDTGKSGWWVSASLCFSIIFYALIIKNFVLQGIYSHHHAMTNPVSMQSFLPVIILGVISCALGLTIFIFTVLPSHAEANKYGENPLPR